MLVSKIILSIVGVSIGLLGATPTTIENDHSQNTVNTQTAIVTVSGSAGILAEHP